MDSGLTQGDTYLLPPAFEFKAIEFDWDDVQNYLLNTDIRQWATRSYRQLLTPKHRYSFRIATQLDPFDFLVFSALVYESGDDLEEKRVPVGEDVVFSYRFKPEPDGSLFDKNVSYGKFYGATVERIESGKFGYVVEADIADFYPRIYYHVLESAISSASKKSNHSAALLGLIKGWNQQVSIGIPVGPAAARLLAEVTLDDVDRLLLSEGITFVRYNDDYRIFTETYMQAWQALALLANTLHNNHSLTLQAMKTRISAIEEFDDRRLRPVRNREVEQLADGFRDIAEALGLEDIYDDIEFDDLEPDAQKQIEALNLSDLLFEQIRGGTLKGCVNGQAV